MRRCVSVAIVGVALVVAGCGTPSRPVSTGSVRGSETAVIQQALLDVHGDHSAIFAPFRREQGTVPCRIGVGGPYPGKVIRATCSTTVKAAGQDKVITFTETWNAVDFRMVHSPATGQLTAVWTITVDPAGQLVGESHGGAFPPQAAT